VVGVLCTGEIRGQVAFSNNWNFGTVLSTVLSGGNAVPPTPSAATGSAQVVVSRDGTMGMAFLGVSGGLALGVWVSCPRHLRLKLVILSCLWWSIY